MNRQLHIQTFTGSPLEQADFRLVLSHIYPSGQIRWKQKEDIHSSLLISYTVAYEHNKAIGRACLYHNPDMHWDGETCVCIGNFECINDSDVTTLLLSTIEKQALEMGYNRVIGPLNGDTFHSYRLPLYSIDRPFFTEDFFPDYYATLWRNCGYKTIETYYSASADVPNTNIPAYPPAENICIRNIRKNDFEKELREIYRLMQDCFLHNRFYTPAREEDFVKQYLPLETYIDERFFLLAETENKLAACMFCLPDHYAPEENKQLVIKTIFVHPRARQSGIMLHLGNIIYHRAAEEHYQKIIHAYMHSHNGSGKLSGKFGGKVFGSYALFGKKLKHE